MTSPPEPANPLTVPTGVPLLEQQAEPAEDIHPEIILITGASGAGRSRAAAVLEDLDWYVVDNLPPKLLEALSGMMSQGAGGVHRLAVVVDVRSGQFFDDLLGALDDLRARHIDYRIVYLDADDEELVRRYESNRRPHPLQGEGRMLDGITHERELLADLRTRADVTIDTSDMSVHDLARTVHDLVAGETDRALRINVVSFGFKYALPLDADHVLDVRFIANPYWVTELRHLSGKDALVRDYVLARPGVRTFIDRYVEMLSGILDGYLREQKPYVTIAVGCTGGKHRSVAITEAIASGLRARGESARTLHRDLGRE